MISFKSKITVGILDFFFLNQEEKRYVNELAKILNADPKNLYRKLEELEKEGILKSEFRGRERYFFLNTKWPLFEHYRQIFLKTYGIESELKKIVKDVHGIKKACIFGSYARGDMAPSSDIDVLVVGDHSILELQKRVNMLQKKTDREFNIVNMDGKDFAKRKKSDQFIKNIFNDKRIELL